MLNRLLVCPCMLFFAPTDFTLQVDHTLSRLNVLKDRIESIEALVTIDLDHRRNELVAFDLVSLSTADIPDLS